MLKRLVRYVAKALDLERMVYPAPMSRMSLLPRTRYNYAAEVGDGYGSSVIMAPVKWMQRSLVEAPIIMRDLVAEETVNHDLIRRIQRPNDFYNGTMLWMATIADYILSGNAYWLKIKTQLGEPVELWWIPSWLISPKWPLDGRVFISHYEYTPGYEAPIRLEIEDVVHFRNGINPSNPRLGQSDLAALYREIFIDDESANFTASLLRNMGVASVIIAPKNPVHVDDARAVEKAISQKLTGDNRGKPITLTMPTDITEFGFDPQKLQISHLRNVSEERVCADLGIPAAVVGFGSGLEQTKVGATMREMISLAWKNAVIPRMRMLSRDVQHSLFPDYALDNDRYELEFDISEVEALQESQNERVERITRSVSAGILTVRMAQEELGFDTDDAADYYLRSMATTEVPFGERIQPVEAITRVTNPNLLPAPPPALESGNPQDDEDEEKRRKAKQDPPRRQPTDHQKRFMRIMDEIRPKFEARYQPRLERFFDGLGKQAASLARKYLKQSLSDFPENWQSLITEMEMSTHQTTLAQLNASHYNAVGKETFGLFGETIGLEVGYPDRVSQEILELGGKRMGLVDLDGQLKANLFKILEQAREEQMGIGQIVARIRDEIPKGPWADAATRARVIARTETLHAQRVSVLVSARESGVVSKVLIFDDLLGHGDQDCAYWNNREVELDRAMQLAEEEHPNGTRHFAPVI